MADKKMTEEEKAFLERRRQLGEKMMEAERRLRSRDYPKAIAILEEVTASVEAEVLEEEEKYQYLHFPNQIELILYKVLWKQEKPIRYATFPFSVVYPMQAAAYKHQKRYEEALQILQKDLHWDPASADALLDCAEIQKQLGRDEKAFEDAVSAPKLAYTPKQLTKGYTIIADVLKEKDPACAKACLQLALAYTPQDGPAYRALEAIDPEKKIETSEEGLEKAAKEHGFPVGADPDVLSILVSYGDGYKQEKQYEMALDLYSCAYGLTHDEDLGKTVQELSTLFEERAAGKEKE